jgi:hypothetical protein
MDLYARLRAALSDCTFGSPATEEQVRRVERELGVTLPEDVRRLYLQADGFYCGSEAPGLKLLPLIGPGPRKVGAESVLSWNQFCRGPGWEEGSEPPAHVLELGFLNDDEYFGIDLRTGEVVVVYRRGNEVEPAGRGLCELLDEEYADQQRIHKELEDHVWKGRVLYDPVKAAEAAQHDIDRVILGYQEARPAAWFLKELTDDPAAPGGTWVMSVGLSPEWEQIRLKSPTGDFPFVIESDITGTTISVVTVEQAVAAILAEVQKDNERWSHESGGEA